MAWNDDSATDVLDYGLSSGGGGVSIFTAAPSWQTGVPGIPAGGAFRLVPDVALDASPNNAPYAYCSSDSTAWASGQYSSCNAGLRDSSSQDLTVAGGTSFAAPIFSGMLAIINQAKGYTSQGVVNPTLYILASNPATYASAFHDITTGNNECGLGISYCSTADAASFAATVGYDQATGLGSVDLNNLLNAWPQSSSGTTPSKSFTLVLHRALHQPVQRLNRDRHRNLHHHRHAPERLHRNHRLDRDHQRHRLRRHRLLLAAQHRSLRSVARNRNPDRHHPGQRFLPLGHVRSQAKRRHLGRGPRTHIARSAVACGSRARRARVWLRSRCSRSSRPRAVTAACPRCWPSWSSPARPRALRLRKRQNRHRHRDRKHRRWWRRLQHHNQLHHHRDRHRHRQQSDHRHHDPRLHPHRAVTGPQ